MIFIIIFFTEFLLIHIVSYAQKASISQNCSTKQSVFHCKSVGWEWNYATFGVSYSQPLELYREFICDPDLT